MKPSLLLIVVTLFPLWMLCGCQSTSGTTSAAPEPASATATADVTSEELSKAEEIVGFEIDAHDAGDGYGTSASIENDGLYTFSVEGEAQDATWELFVVNPNDGMIFEERHCRFVAQKCDAVSLHQPIQIQAGSFVCAIPSVNGFTIDDENDLLPEGASVLHIDGKVRKIDHPWHCENN